VGAGAEWETNYSDWGALYSAVQAELSLAGNLSVETTNLLLYVLARDNECETVADMLAEAPAVFTQLIEAGMEYPDSDARWQLASRLPRALGEAARRPLAVLRADPDEYVRRRATFALAELTASHEEFSLGELPGEWFAATDLPNIDEVERELRAELPPGHVLDGVTFELVAVRRHLKDVVIWLPDSRRWGWTHLTWNSESDPRMPSTGLYDSWEGLVADHR
jgi:hypothetical protein